MTAANLHPCPRVHRMDAWETHMAGSIAEQIELTEFAPGGSPLARDRGTSAWSNSTAAMPDAPASLGRRGDGDMAMVVSPVEIAYPAGLRTVRLRPTCAPLDSVHHGHFQRVRDADQVGLHDPCRGHSRL